MIQNLFDAPNELLRNTKAFLHVCCRIFMALCLVLHKVIGCAVGKRNILVALFMVMTLCNKSFRSYYGSACV